MAKSFFFTLSNLFFAFSLSACVGPMSPFGAIEGLQTQVLEETEPEQDDWDGQGPRVVFEPSRQVLHEVSEVSVVIEDPRGIPEEFQLKLSYNGMDIPADVVAKAGRDFLDLGQKRVRLDLGKTRVLPQRDNQIKATYKRDAEARPIVGRFLPPRCAAFDYGRSLSQVPGFDLPKDWVRQINKEAVSKKFNPYYLAGLIAQESNFQPLAVSPARALGLTQITTLGEMEVFRMDEGWPRYPGIDRMSYAALRLAIQEGRVNARNEWRLNPLLSVRGGADYLRILFEYWNRPDKKVLLQSSLGKTENILGDVILASYNSGASRVSTAIERRGRRWLSDKDLKEARRYVRRVVSYCNQFVERGH